MRDNKQGIRTLIKVWLDSDIDILCEFEALEFDFMRKHFVYELSLNEAAVYFKVTDSLIFETFESCMTKIGNIHNDSLASFLREYHQCIEGKSGVIPIGVDFFNVWLN